MKFNDENTLKICYIFFTLLYVGAFSLMTIIIRFYGDAANGTNIFSDTGVDGIFERTPFCMGKLIFGLYCFISISLLVGECFIIHTDKIDKKEGYQTGAIIVDSIAAFILLILGGYLLTYTVISNSITSNVLIGGFAGVFFLKIIATCLTLSRG